MLFRKLWTPRVIVPLIGLAIVLIGARASNPPTIVQLTPQNEPYRLSITGFSTRELFSLSTPQEHPTNLISDTTGKLYFSHDGQIITVNPSNQQQATPLKPIFDKDESSSIERLRPGLLALQPNLGLAVFRDFSQQKSWEWDLAKIDKDLKASEWSWYLNYPLERITPLSQIATDSNGNIYLTHPEYGEIWQISPGGQGRFWLTLPSMPQRGKRPVQAQPAKPTSITFDKRTQAIYVFDAANQLVYAIPIRPNGNPDGAYMLADMQGRIIAAMAIDDSGRLLLAEHRGTDSGIWRVENNGRFHLLMRGLNPPVSMIATGQGIYVLEDVPAKEEKQAAHRTLKFIYNSSAEAVVPTMCAIFGGNTHWGYGTVLDLESKDIWFDAGDTNQWELSPSPLLHHIASFTDNNSYIGLRESETTQRQSGLIKGDLIWVYQSRHEIYRRVQILAYDIALADSQRSLLSVYKTNKVAYLTVVGKETVLNVMDVDTMNIRTTKLPASSMLTAWNIGYILTAQIDEDRKIRQFTSYIEDTLEVKFTWETPAIADMPYKTSVENKIVTDASTCIECRSGIRTNYIGSARISYLERAGDSGYQMVYVDFGTGKIVRAPVESIPQAIELAFFDRSPNHRVAIFRNPSYPIYNPPRQVDRPDVHFLDIETGKFYRTDANTIAWSPDDSVAYLVDRRECTLRKLDFNTGQITLLKDNIDLFGEERYAPNAFLMIRTTVDGCKQRHPSEPKQSSGVFGVNLKTGELVQLTQDYEAIYSEKECTGDCWLGRYEPYLIFATTRGILITDHNFTSLKRYDERLYSWSSSEPKSLNFIERSVQGWLGYAISRNPERSRTWEYFALNYDTGEVYNISREITYGNSPSNAFSHAPIRGIHRANRVKRALFVKEQIRDGGADYELGLFDMMKDEYHQRYFPLFATDRYPATFWSPDDKFFGALIGYWDKADIFLYDENATLIYRSRIAAGNSLTSGDIQFGACPR
jgi:sugar lactone lactonase YvrE